MPLLTSAPKLPLDPVINGPLELVQFPPGELSSFVPRQTTAGAQVKRGELLTVGQDRSVEKNVLTLVNKLNTGMSF